MRLLRRVSLQPIGTGRIEAGTSSPEQRLHGVLFPRLASLPEGGDDMTQVAGQPGELGVRELVRQCVPVPPTPAAPVPPPLLAAPAAPRHLLRR